MTHWSKIGDMRDQSLWCFCGYFFPVQSHGETLTTGCLSDIKRLKSAEMRLCLFLPVLHCVLCFCVSSLFTVIFNPFLFFPPSQPMKILCELLVIGIILLCHNKEKTSHICKWALASWTGFLNKHVSRGKDVLLFWISAANRMVWGQNMLSNQI